MNTLLKIVIILTLPYLGFSQKKIGFEQAPVNFIIKNAGLNVNGSIGGLEGFITLDSQNSGIVKIEGTLDPNTIHTGITLRDNHLKKADYFNVKEFAKISMTTTEIKKIGNHKYLGNFHLTIKGITKTISSPFTFSATKAAYVLKGEFAINRLDFELGEKSIILSDNVKIKIELKTEAIGTLSSK